MMKSLFLLQCLALLVLSVSGLPVEEPAKNPTETIDITPTGDKLPKAGDIDDLDELEEILAEEYPDLLPEFEEAAKNPGGYKVDTVDVTPTEDKLPETGQPTDNSDKIIPDAVPDQLPEFEEAAKKPADTADTAETVEVTPTEDKLPKAGSSEGNAPETGESAGNAPTTGETEDSAPNTGETGDDTPENGESDENEPKTGESIGLDDLDKLIPELIPDLPNLPKLPDLIPGCKKENESCQGFPNCCGDLNCYWADGFSLIKPGQCKPCLAEGDTCIRSGQCCGNNDDDDEDPDAVLCDKGTNPFEDGVCAVKRTTGPCYKNKQCKEHKCHKKWYKLTGNCDQE